MNLLPCITVRLFGPANMKVCPLIHWILSQCNTIQITKACFPTIKFNIFTFQQDYPTTFGQVSSFCLSRQAPDKCVVSLITEGKFPDCLIDTNRKTPRTLQHTDLPQSNKDTNWSPVRLLSSLPAISSLTAFCSQIPSI